ncbi:MAG: Crp/Fnr family transcriptional regulator [Gammaproteobacteria bacterium]|nr:Crp/Fnr family transcriptional regulator [Gammaproteobacteria bacterium]
MNSILTSIPLFSNLASKHLELLSGQIQRQKYARNSIIIAEGDLSDSLYIVNEGKVKIYISDADGREMQLKILEPGDYFGELALIDQKPRSASAMTICDSQLSVITSKSFLKCLADNQKIALIMLQVLAKRLRDATELQRQLALMDVYGRLRVTLLASAKDGDGIHKLEPKPTQQDIANKIGASREMVSRILSDLRAHGYIDINKTSIVIKKKIPEKW